VNRIYLSLRSETAQRIVKSQRILRPDHAARHASRHPTPPREKRACRGPGLAANSKNSAGEPSTGACIGMPFCSCLVIRGYASAAAGYVGPAEFPLCAALIRGGSISRHPPPTGLSFCRCAPNRQRAIIFLRDDSALVACGSARTPASPLWFLFNVAALQTASELHLWRRNSSACSRSIMAGGTSSHGIGRLSNEVTATFATQRVHSPRYKYKG
jgi:hypothetical protein